MEHASFFRIQECSELPGDLEAHHWSLLMNLWVEGKGIATGLPALQADGSARGNLTLASILSPEAWTFQIHNLPQTRLWTGKLATFPVGT